VATSAKCGREEGCGAGQTTTIKNNMLSFFCFNIKNAFVINYEQLPRSATIVSEMNFVTKRIDCHSVTAEALSSQGSKDPRPKKFRTLATGVRVT
jgi:hypothetical protein